MSWRLSRGVCGIGAHMRMSRLAGATTAQELFRTRMDPLQLVCSATNVRSQLTYDMSWTVPEASGTTLTVAGGQQQRGGTRGGRHALTILHIKGPRRKLLLVAREREPPVPLRLLAGLVLWPTPRRALL